jgi:isoleucyl-tRNA synthetase
LITTVDEAYKNFEPTRAGRAIQEFVDEHLSNWYVRLSRRRFWKGQYTSDKISAYQTLYNCLTTVAQLASPIAPFFSEQLYRDLNQVTGKQAFESVHLSVFPRANNELIDHDLEERMEMAQKFSSMILSLRKKANIRVRQPLKTIMIPITDAHMKNQLQEIENLILSEVNVKEVIYLSDDNTVLIKKIKPNFKTLGPRYGKLMKEIALVLTGFSQFDIRQLEINGTQQLDLNGQKIELTLEDVEITTEDIPGWAVAAQDKLTVALDLTLNEELIKEGLVRELVNRVQNMRKDSGFEVTDHILLEIEADELVRDAIRLFESYITSETLGELKIVTNLTDSDVVENELVENITAKIKISKVK